MSDLITNVKKYTKGWSSGLPETPCGFGSKLKETRLQRKWIPEIFKQYNIKTVADIGAGDLNWIKEIELSVKYTAYDLVPRQPEVVEFNLIEEIPPKVDLIMCLWVLNHFPIPECIQAIENLKASGAKYLLMTYRERFKEDHPSEIEMPFIEALTLNHKHDQIRLIEL